jgi:light-regulated signal transduction histidine kinase (bacteriophytochrome)
VIIHTGNASYDTVKEAINLGGYAYLEKLSDPAELLGTVHRACRESIDRYARQLEKAVAARTEELARSNRELENFASVVAHDLRSPLLTISGFCQILQEEFSGHLEPQAEMYLSRIIEAVARMSQLINDLLNYARVGRREEPHTLVDLGDVLSQVQANLAGPIHDAQATLVVAEPLPLVQGNPTLLVQLLQNLVGNAIKFRRAEPPIIRITAQREDGRWRLAVADNGIGIHSEHFDKLFQVFHRLHRQEQYPGTGIGLALCKKIVEHHGGRIWLESEPDRGTTFYFTLPAADEQHAAAATKQIP